MYYFIDYGKFEVFSSVTQPWNIKQAAEFLIVKVPLVSNHFKCKLLYRFYMADLFLSEWIPQLCSILEMRMYKT